ncbi:hypothetical protein Tco_0006867 [Tanacetum coccineum]
MFLNASFRVFKTKKAGSDEGILKLNELTNLVTKLSERIGVLEDDLRKTKKTYSSAFTKLILRVKKLEARGRKLTDAEVTRRKQSTETEPLFKKVDLFNLKSFKIKELVRKGEAEVSAEASTNDNGEFQITATIDGHSMSITEATLRRHLKLDDQDGVISIPQLEFLSIALMRIINTNSDNQKKTACEQFNSNIATDDDLRKTKKSYSFAFTKLILRVKKLEARVKIGKARRRAKVVISDEDVEDDSSKQGKKLTDAEKGSVEVSTAGATKGTTSKVPVVSTVEENISTAGRTVTYTRRSEEKRTRKDKGKAIMIESKPKKKSKKEIEQERQRVISEAKTSKKIDWNDPSVKRYHALKMKPKTIAQARRNMIKYLKNQGNFKISDFKGMSYNKIRLIFEKVWDFNQHIEPIDMEHGSEKMKSPEKMKKKMFKESGAKIKNHFLEKRTFKNKIGRSCWRSENSKAIHMLTEKKYPLSQEMISKMLKKKLEVDHESSQAFELLRKSDGLPMALSDSKVNNDKSCSKTCLTNYEALKKQYDDLLVKLDDTGFKASTYKRGLSILEGQIIKYKESEVLFSEEIALLKRSVGHKEYLMGLLRTELEKVKEEKEGFEFKIAKLTPLDLSYSGLEEFKQPEFNEYGPRDSSLKPNTVCDKESDNSKENTDDSLKQQQKTDSKTSSVKSPLKADKDWKEKFFNPANHVREEEPKKAREDNDAPIIEDWVSDDEDEVELPKVEKKTCYNLLLLKKECLVNTVRQNVNTVRARGFNAVKPSACWVWRPIKPNGASLSNSQLNDKGFVDSGCSRHMTGNIAHLSDFKDFDGGYVTFGGGAYGGRITGKCTIKTDNLDFDDVYFVKELKSAEASTNDNREVQITATIDGHSMSITEASLR